MSRQKRSSIDLSIRPKKAIVCGVEISSSDDTEVSLDELVMLLENLDIPTVARVTQKRSAPDPASFVGAGKAEEIRDFAQKSEATLLVVDDFLSPTQKSNLQKLTSMTVWDRAFVIMKIFEQGPYSRAKLQVELAQYRYEIPSLKGLGHQMSRTGGGIGTRVQGDRIRKAQKEAREKDKEHHLPPGGSQGEKKEETRPPQEGRAFTAALVGYTNSGKSTLLRSLSRDSGILTANQLFSTLDTLVRRISFRDGKFPPLRHSRFYPEAAPELVAAFRATLEEVSEADLLLLVIDSADKDPVGNMEIVLETLKELKADGLPRIIVLNKIDKTGSEAEFIAMELRARGEDTVKVCALTGEGFEELLERVKRHASEYFERRMALPLEEIMTQATDGM